MFELKLFFSEYFKKENMQSDNSMREIVIGNFINFIKKLPLI